MRDEFRLRRSAFTPGLARQAAICVLVLAALFPGAAGDAQAASRYVPVDKLGFATGVLPVPDEPGSRVAIAREDRSIEEIVGETIAGQSGDWGVAIRDLQTGETFVVNGHEYFPAASLYKLIVMYAVYRDGVPLDEVLTPARRHFIEAGADEPLTPGEPVTVAEALEQMITLSSNAAAHLLAERVGWQRVNELCEELGLEHTGIPVGARRNEFDDWRAELASTSPADMLRFFTLLDEGLLVDRERSAEMLSLLERQQISDRFPAELPAEATVAHKTGNLPGIVNDAGIISGPGGRFVLVVLTHNVDEGDATLAQAELARTLYNRMVASDTASGSQGAG